MCAESQGITWPEVASLLGCRRSDYIAMLYRTFTDDSKDQKQQDVVTVGAVIASHGDWTPVRKQWNRRLQRDGLNYFRSTEYHSLRGQFERFRDQKKYPKPKGSEAAKALRDQLESILKDAPVVGIGVAIPIKLYKEFVATVPGAKGKFGTDIYYSALQTLLVECTRTLQEEYPVDHKGRENRIAFACDSTEMAPRYAKAYVDFKHRNPGLARIMGSLVHLDDQLNPPIQAADMMASLTKELTLPILEGSGGPSKDALVVSANEPPHLKGTVYKVIVWDYEWMERLLAAQIFGRFYSDILMRTK